MRRLACLWFGHCNVVTLDLLTFEPVFTCLRCRVSGVPESRRAVGADETTEER